MSLGPGIALGLVSLLVAAVLGITEGVLTHLTMARATTLIDEDAADDAVSLPALIARRETNLGAVVTARVATQMAVVFLVVDQVVDHRPNPLGWIATAAACAAVLGGVEVRARTLAVVRTDRWAVRVAPVARAVGRVAPLRWIGALFAAGTSPGVAPVPGSGNGTAGSDDDEDWLSTTASVSEEELLAMADVAADAEVIDSSEQALIRSIIEFGDTIVREVMVPRPDMVTVEGNWPVADVMEVVIHNGFSRIPVTGDGIDDVVGLAYAKDLMRAERDGNGQDQTGTHVRQVRFVPEQQRVSALLPEMQAQQFHMAVVVDEYGGVAGLVTLEDLIEELVGEIVDEFDVEDPMAEPLAAGGYRVNARMPLDEASELIGVELPEGDWDTVGGLLFGTLGKVPHHGEAVEIDGVRLTAARVQGRRIGLVRIELAAPAHD